MKYAVFSTFILWGKRVNKSTKVMRGYEQRSPPSELSICLQFVLIPTARAKGTKQIGVKMRSFVGARNTKLYLWLLLARSPLIAKR